MISSGKRVGPAVLAALVLLLAAGSAQAATRYAAPGGAEAGNCTEPEHPCTIYRAAGAAPGVAQANDVVVLAPGEYSDSAGDLGPGKTVQLAQGISVHGETGAPRPLIRLVEASSGPGAFTVESGDILSNFAVDTSAAKSNLTVLGGTVENAIVRNISAVAESIACVQVAGLIRDSVCLASAANSVALGERRSSAANSTATLRNVTAVGTGSGSRGLSYAITGGGGGVTVNAMAVIAQGVQVDVDAEGLESAGTAGHVTIELAHSDFSSESAGQGGTGTAKITAPPASENIGGVPLLAADGYHELEGSPTIDTGAVDGSSGATDIDGQSRSIGPPDIGADEWLHSTAVTVKCDPAEVVLTDALPGSGTDCRARVTDENTNFIAPTGTVAFSSSSTGEFSAGSCTLVPSASGAEANCQVHYTPKLGSARKHTITVTYAGDGAHEGSQGDTTVAVSEAPLVCATGRKGHRKVSCPGPGQKKTLTVHLKKKPSKKTSRRLAKFTFSANRAGARFECKLDGRPFRACRSPYKHRVKPGHHRFSVRAVRGKVRSKPASYGWLVLRR